MTDQIQDQDVELDENEIEEAHDPKNAEQQSVASVKKAEGAGKKAPKRKGDKDGKDEPAQLGGGMKQPAQVESVEFDGDFSEDLNALVESEATLSEEFKAKTALIFEAAVKSKLAEEIDRLETEYAEQLAEEVSTTKADLVEKVDSYLNYVVENWMEENKMAIQSGLRSEIAEDFMGKLKDLFTESYIEVPESKIDLVDELATANEELEEQFNDATAKAIELSEALESYKRKDIIREASRDLAETQVEKLASLAESIEFESEEAFAAKVATLKESYFAKAKTTESIIEESEEADEATEVSPMMEKYLQALRKTQK
jgi:hypothetical protein